MILPWHLQKYNNPKNYISREIENLERYNIEKA